MQNSKAKKENTQESERANIGRGGIKIKKEVIHLATSETNNNLPTRNNGQESTVDKLKDLNPISLKSSDVETSLYKT